MIAYAILSCWLRISIFPGFCLGTVLKLVLKLSQLSTTPYCLLYTPTLLLCLSVCIFHNDHYETSQFYNCLTTYQLFPSITRPTRITSHSQTLIDNIFSSAWSKLVRAAIIVSDLSDHLPIVALFATERNCKRAYYNTTSSRKINDENVGKFDALLADINWDPVTKISADGDANLAYDKFMEIYKTVYDKAFPIVLHRTNSKKPTFKQPWMTPGLLKSCKKKNLLYLKFIRSPSVANKERFIKYRNKFKSIRIKVEKNFYEAEFSKMNGDLRLTWKLIRTLMKVNNDEDHIEALKINGTGTSDPHAMANGLNDFFTNVAQSLAGKLKSPINHYSRYLPSPKLTSMGIIPTTPEEILDIGRTCKGTRSKGVDDVDPHLAGMHLHRIATTLSIIINCSLNTGIVPDAIKIAKIVPIFKNGEKNDVSNYRPISILPYFSKFYEKLMYKRLSDYVKISDIVYHSQHGFQQGHSTYMALINMQDRIRKAIDNNEYSVGVFFDLAKAFDAVNHKILLEKL